jgi:hypothetical protein
MKEQLNRVLVPVLLGDGAQPVKIARRLYRRFGVLSHIYCSRLPLLAHFCACVRIVRTPTYLRGDLLCTDLCAFAKEYPDLLFCLIPCTEEHRVFCTAHARELEAYYVIVHPEQLQEDALPYLYKEELPI